MAPRTRAKWAYRTAKEITDSLGSRLTNAARQGEAVGESFLSSPAKVRQYSLALYYMLLLASVIGEGLGRLSRSAAQRTPDRAQSAGVFAVVSLLVVLLVAAIVLILGPTILALLTQSLPTTNGTRWNSTYTDVANNVDTAFVLGGLLLVIVVIGAVITVLISAFMGGFGGMGGGGGGGFM